MKRNQNKLTKVTIDEGNFCLMYDGFCEIKKKSKIIQLIEESNQYKQSE